MEELLADCGLSKIEQKVLMFLLQGGSSRGSLIAKRIQEKRPSVYTALKRLIERGLVCKITKNKVNLYDALEKKQIVKSLRNNALEEYHEKENSIELLIPRLENLVSKQTQTLAGYQITSTDSLSATLTMIEEVLCQDYDSIVDLENCYAIPEVNDLAYDLAKRNKLKDLRIREALRDNNTAKKWSKTLSNNPNYQVKMFKSKPLYSDLIITKDTVYLFNYDLREPLCLYIKHKNYVNFMRFVFNSFWNSL